MRETGCRLPARGRERGERRRAQPLVEDMQLDENGYDEPVRQVYREAPA